jgi:PleD family two-component response regulator
LERDRRNNSIADEDILPQDRQTAHSGFGGAVLVRETACLLATDLPPTLPNTLQQELQSHGWNVVAVSKGTDCLTALQMRNWDVVLIDDDLPQIPGASCIMAFREWEEKNRVNRQKNVFLICEGDIPSPDDNLALVHLPEGCNGVIGRPVSWTYLQYLMRPKEGDRGLDIVVR